MENVEIFGFEMLVINFLEKIFFLKICTFLTGVLGRFEESLICNDKPFVQKVLQETQSIS